MPPFNPTEWRLKSVVLAFIPCAVLALWSYAPFSSEQIPSKPGLSGHWQRWSTADEPLLDQVPQPYDLEDVQSMSLFSRDDYSCSASKPCSNGACCGKSGYCNYDNVTCGAGCISNCDAKAECGQWAKTPGQKCPLNVCCSQYGFCGTTSDFCSTAKQCQSNCVEHPSPPGGSSGGNVLSRVIGYYEAWNAASKCRPFPPENLPIDALTHINYAFAYIDPGSLKLTTMDSTVSPDLFQRLSDLKQTKPELKIFVSVGGWTFSDNGTVTQPLFGAIARDSGKRTIFAKNVLAFMQQFNYDGIDIDWEYPGAPDRGGKPEDTQNYVALLQTLRSVFNTSPRKLQITFTAPSSYWYLRWFDLPGLSQYADWINLMTYDLHGVWDATNPIGAIVQGHTNLTEITLATELFWRVGIPASKVAMGFGFYGRSFKLANSGCTTPGCPFDPAGADPGKCTATSGYLSYYEIQDILSGATPSSRKRAGVQPIHDTKSAVNYVVYNGNQWVSYDDAVTFKQKVDWANSVGLSGSLIWASDLDDTKFGAHAGLLGRAVANTSDIVAKSSSLARSQNAVDLTGKNCVVSTLCVDRNTQFQYCDSGQIRVGWAYQKDQPKNSRSPEKCPKGQAHPICCPATTNFKQCTWRGNGNPASNGGDCNGQCHEGEVDVMHNSWGGWDSEGNQYKCGRGTKAFCCTSPQWDVFTHGCYWTGCGGGCRSNEDSLIRKDDSCGNLGPKKTFCCPRPASLSKCRWTPSSIWDTDCTNNKCADDEVEVARDSSGDSSGPWPGCYWGRKLAGCCHMTPPSANDCTYDVCIDLETCTDEEWDWTNVPSIYNTASKRSINSDQDSIGLVERASGPPSDPPKGTTNSRNPRWAWIEVVARAFAMWYRAHPPRGQLYGDPSKPGFPGNGMGQGVSQRFYGQSPSDQSTCGNNQIRGIPFSSWKDNDKNGIPNGGQTEHPWPKGAFFRWSESASNGIQNWGSRPYNRMGTPAVNSDFWANRWAKDNSLPANWPAVGRGTDGNGAGGVSPRNALDRMGEALGSNYNRWVFILTDAGLNQEKNQLENLNDPIAQASFRTLVRNAMNSTTGAAAMLRHIGAPIRVANYLRQDEVATAWQTQYIDALGEAQRVEAYDTTAAGLAASWREFNGNGASSYWRAVEARAQQWMRDQIAYVRDQINSAQYRADNADDILAQLQQLESQIGTVTWPAGKDASTGTKKRDSTWGSSVEWDDRMLVEERHLEEGEESLRKAFEGFRLSLE